VGPPEGAFHNRRPPAGRDSWVSNTTDMQQRRLRGIEEDHQWLC